MPSDTVTGTSAENETKALYEWVKHYSGQLVTSALSRNEVAPALGKAAHVDRMRVLEVLSEAGEVFLSDPAIENAAIIHSRLPVYASLHLGLVRAANDYRLAKANPAMTIQGVVTYDPEFAAICQTYGIEVFSPGRARGWFNVRG